MAAMESPPDTSRNEAKRSRQERDPRLFDSIAAEYCRKDLLPASRRARRHRFECTLCRLPLSEWSRVLEIGCGAWFAATYLADRFGTYVGIDRSEKLIELARTYNARSGVTFHTTSIEDFRAGERFDLVFMIGVLHHNDTERGDPADSGRAP